MPKIKNMGTATMIFKEGLIVSGSAADRSNGYSDYALVVTGSAIFDTRDGTSGDSGGITVIKDESDPVFVRFVNDDDPTSWYAYMAMDSAENFYIAPGRSQDFYFITRENSGSDYFFPLRIFDNGKIKFHQAAQSSSDNQVELPADVVFSVSGSTSGTDGVSVFGGNVVVSGSLSMTGSSGLTSLNVYGNTNGSYVATIDNDQNSNGHVLKLSTDGNGSGSRILEMEDGDGDIVFRARADGRFGFGPDGVDSMGAGTFVVGIDNSSHTADIAISQRLQHLGDSNTYLDFPSNDTFNLVAAGNSFLKYDSGNILINNANADVDTKIMADNGNVVLHVDAGDNRVGIGTTSPISELDVAGKIAITAEVSTPSQPADGKGYLYTKSDGKIYWRSHDVSEVDLTAAGGGGSGDNLSLTALKTSNYTAANWEMVLVNLVGASGDVTITLPAASSNKQVAVKIAGLAMGKEVIVDGNSSETIDGLTTRIMNTDYESMHLISDGSNWWRIS